MRANVVVIGTPSIGGGANLADGSEDIWVDEFVANPAIERLDLRVLSRLARLNEVQRDFRIRRPTKHFPATELRAVIASKCSRIAANKRDVFDLSNDVAAAERESRITAERFAREVIDDIENSVGPALVETSVNEVHRPPFIRPRYRFDRVAANVTNVALTSSQNMKSEATIDTSKRAFADCKAFASNHD